MTTKKTKQTFQGSFPPEMRHQLFPLCCGCSIISGFKDAHTLSDDDLLAKIKDTLDTIPDFQVFNGENMHPAVTLAILNSSQSASAKITGALIAAGFQQFGDAKLWSGTGTFWVRDKNATFKLHDIDWSKKANLVGIKKAVAGSNAGVHLTVPAGVDAPKTAVG